MPYGNLIVSFTFYLRSAEEAIELGQVWTQDIPSLQSLPTPLTVPLFFSYVMSEMVK